MNQSVKLGDTDIEIVREGAMVYTTRMISSLQEFRDIVAALADPTVERLNGIPVSTFQE